ncbi:MAG: IS5 family transposase [Burkholderiaceae bacterium]
MTRRYALRDDQWERIEPVLPGREGHVGVTARDNRLFVDAVLYRYRAGIAWRDLPERFGDFRVVHLRPLALEHNRRVAALVCRAGTGPRQRVRLNRQHDCACPPAQRGGKKRGPGQNNQAIGRSRGGLSTKIHATVDALGNPTGFHLTPGQAHDLEGADVLLKDSEAEAVIADKAYDAQARVIEPLLKAGKQVVIPPRSTRKQQRDYDRHLYKARHLIENFFARLKQYRAIATRYDKTARNFLGAIHLAAAVVWLN